MNKDMILEDLLHFCKDIDLVEARPLLRSRLPIPTHKCSHHAIAGIYVSQALLHNAFGGILSLRAVTPSNHWAMWLDIQAHWVKMVENDPVIWPACH